MNEVTSYLLRAPLPDTTFAASGSWISMAAEYFNADQREQLHDLPIIAGSWTVLTVIGQASKGSGTFRAA
jgi:hypothetical protein